MTVRQRIVRSKVIPLKPAEHAFSAFQGVVNVVGVLTTSSLKKLFVWNCYARVVLRNQGKMARRVLKLYAFEVITSIPMARELS